MNTSRKLSWGNTLFFFKNLSFGIIPAIIYLLISWATGIYVGESFSEISILEIGYLGLSEWREAFIAGFHSALLNPIGMILYFILFSGFLFFTNALSKKNNATFAILHAVTHITAGFLIYWLAAYLTLQYWEPKSIPQYLSAGAIIFTLSWVISSSLLGIYLLVSLNLFGYHLTEAFSSLRIEDWKGFLRLNIRNDGSLILYFIGIQNVPKQWRRRTPEDTSESMWVSNDRKATPPEIIDYVVIPSNSETSS